MDLQGKVDALRAVAASVPPTEVKVRSQTGNAQQALTYFEAAGKQCDTIFELLESGDVSNIPSAKAHYRQAKHFIGQGQAAVYRGRNGVAPAVDDAPTVAPPPPVVEDADTDTEMGADGGSAAV